MKVLNKVLSLVLVLSLIMAVAGCTSNTETEGNGTTTEKETDTNATTENATTGDATTEVTDTRVLEAMTTENITLTYASWENEALNNYMAEKFMEKYPNITVEMLTVPLNGYNDSLVNLAGAGNLPDVFWYLGNCDIPIRNGWFGDMTPYFENDIETDEMLETLKVQGYFDGEHKLATPGKYLPYTVFLDKNLFERLNVPMPAASWKYSEMLELMKKMTVPEQGIFGYNTFTQIFTMAPIINNDALGEFGWDGEKYDMTSDWAESLNQHAEFIRTKVHAPFFGTEDAGAAFGDPNLWAASTGKIAMQLDAFWTIGLFAQPEFQDKGINFVPYPVPQGDNAQEKHKPAFVDFAALSSVTEYPREAYELLKFMTFGKEGWNNKINAYRDLVNEDGSKVFTYIDNLPINGDPELWEAVKEFLPQIPEIDGFLAELKQPVPLGGASLPGFQTFLDEVYFGGEYGNIEAAVINGEVNANDVSQEMSDKANQIHQETLQELFDIMQ
jgi:multiple sugar transport system substrate-binding protein